MTFSDNKKESLGDRMRRKSFTAPGMPSPVTTTPEPSVDNIEALMALAGDLSEKPIQWLLMAAQHYEVTGRLQVGLAACPVNLQFGLGRPLHAQSPFCVGPEAIMDLFIWKDGKVKFETGKHPEHVTVHESVEDLITRGEAYAESQAFLETHGINEMSFLVRPPTRPAPGEIEERLKKGQPIDFNIQMEFYSNIYGTRNIKDTAEKLSLVPSRWTSITANLLQLGILLTPDGKSVQTIVDERAVERKPTAEFEALRLPNSAAPKPQPEPLTSLWQTKATVHQPRPVQSEVTMTPASMAKVGVSNHIVTLDAADHNKVLAMLSSPEDGIYTFEAVQFFLAKEFTRACRFKTMLTLVLFSIRTDESKVSPAVSTMVTATVSRIKRDVDVFGHFGPRAFALLLPNVESNQACLLVDRINSELLEITPDLKQHNISLHFGLASVPGDTSEINGLVKAAQVAMFHATSNQLLRTQAQHLRQ
ncbi:MAG: DUF4388 domain-containing protein [Candidatus Melainabacteria bacterium]|nr:DUF4388 domain-containing protein [Candidatus Melainabacteria bacterium]